MFPWCISYFLEETSSLSHSVLFHFFALIAEESFFLSLLAILWNSAFRCLYLSFSPLLFASLLFTAILRPPQTAILLFCISFQWGWSWSLSPVQCHEPQSIVHSLSGTLSINYQLVWLIVREMQIKTTMRYHLIPIKLTIIKKSTNKKCWRGCREKGTLL